MMNAEHTITPAGKIADFRFNPREQERIQSLFKMMPPGQSALDVGARDGYLSMRLSEHYASVTALDLEMPQIENPRIQCVKGDITKLPLPSGAFDLVLCAEVLEHIPPDGLRQACAELMRVSKKHVLIGVPYRQDLREGRTSCRSCGRKNPPWGHVNSFDRAKLEGLFPGMSVAQEVCVGSAKHGTNFLSAYLSDLAGNPYGTYQQEERCVNCGAKLVAPVNRNLIEKSAAFAAERIKSLQTRLQRSRPLWIHILFTRS